MNGQVIADCMGGTGEIFKLYVNLKVSVGNHHNPKLHCPHYFSNISSATTGQQRNVSN